MTQPEVPTNQWVVKPTDGGSPWRVVFVGPRGGEVRTAGTYYTEGVAEEIADFLNERLGM